jgi:hypothetical protein
MFNISLLNEEVHNVIVSDIITSSLHIIKSQKFSVFFMKFLSRKITSSLFFHVNVTFINHQDQIIFLFCIISRSYICLLR